MLPGSDIIIITNRDVVIFLIESQVTLVMYYINCSLPNVILGFFENSKGS